MRRGRECWRLLFETLKSTVYPSPLSLNLSVVSLSLARARARALSLLLSLPLSFCVDAHCLEGLVHIVDYLYSRALVLIGTLGLITQNGLPKRWACLPS